MRLIIAFLLLAVILGYLAGGRLSRLAHLDIRWSLAAVAGLALQLVPVPGRTLPLVLLLVSFGLLLVFAIVNVRARVAGFWLILIGVVLNFGVIAVNEGMPVTRQALVASGQANTLAILVSDAGVKHHLAGPDDHLVFLADAIPIPPIRIVASAGDLVAYAGVAWLVVATMLGRAVPARDRLADEATGPGVTEEVGHAV